MLEASISPLILRYLQFFDYFKRPHLLWRKPMLFCRRIRNVITRDCIGLTIAGRYHCTFARITIYYKKKNSTCMSINGIDVASISSLFRLLLTAFWNCSNLLVFSAFFLHFIIGKLFSRKESKEYNELGDDGSTNYILLIYQTSLHIIQWHITRNPSLVRSYAISGGKRPSKY